MPYLFTHHLRGWSFEFCGCVDFLVGPRSHVHVLVAPRLILAPPVAQVVDKTTRVLHGVTR